VRSLRGRIGAVLLVFGMTTLLTVGTTLWVALRDLHRDAALGSLAELTVPYASQARQHVPLDLLRPAIAGEHPGAEALRAFRESRQGRLASEAFVTFVEEAQEEIEAAGISVLLVSDDSTVVRDPASGSIQTLTSATTIEPPQVRGVVQTGSARIEGLGEVLYAATLVRDPLPDRAVPTLVLAREDDSARLATADLVRALTVAAVVLLVIGIPLAIGLSRSVTRPLRRLAAASAAVAGGAVPEPLPASGPLEVAEASVAFNAMAAEVDATRQAQRQLLADIRHDLRTPLTVIAGFSEALRDGTATGESAERAAVAISDEAGRLERMLADLDHLTMPGVEGPPLRLERIDALALAQATVERFAAEAEARGQDLALDQALAGSQIPELMADRDALDRILGNIVANALSHAPTPGGRIRLEVDSIIPAHPRGETPGLWSAGPGILLAVRDDGPGILAVALPHVFDRFYRADPSRSNRGSGLGLAIVRDLADALGGRAFAQNLPAGGARVGVVLPVAPAPSERASSPSERRQPGGPWQPGTTSR